MSIIYQIADNIISPMGFTTEANIRAVTRGEIGGQSFPQNTWDVPEPFFASVIDDQKIENAGENLTGFNHLTRFEKLVILSTHDAITKAGIDATSPKTLFILSTTKGNIDLLENREKPGYNDQQVHLWQSVKVLANYFKNPNQPLVVSNACISGVSAQIVAQRMLQSGKYKHAIVVGADLVSRFIISGFQSFKALSQQACKPFDANRTGLNLGEGAATIIYGVAENENQLPDQSIIFENGAITNDANHISGPSRTGEGLYLALQSVLSGHQPEEIGFINAHGTATPYNDEMESIALQRSGLQNTPVNSLKGYYGHTLGAAGVIETVISSQALKQNILIKSAGYEQCGVSNPLNIITETQNKPLESCIKMVSGFGGCNAAILLKKWSKK